MQGDLTRLGIAVVYLVSERNEGLLNLHLRQIERNTEVPYTIYAAANRLLPRFQPLLEQNARVTICPCESFTVPAGPSAPLSPHDPLRDEHSFYLEQLVRRAVADGVSHVAILHVDSFPLRRGWEQQLAARLDETCVLAGIMRDEVRDRKPLTACILFHRDFYLRYAPRLLISPKERASDLYRRYARAWPHVRDSGYGYGFRIFAEGLSWYPLRRSVSATRHRFIAGVYDDLVFHLAEAAVVGSLGHVLYIRRWSRWARKIVPKFVRRSMDGARGPGPPGGGRRNGNGSSMILRPTSNG